MDELLALAAGHRLMMMMGGIAGLVLVIGLHDVLQRRHTILHNFPVIGHIRYWAEIVGPELRQYWVANDKEEAPFNRSERRWVYATAKGQNSNFGFGTEEQLYEIGYPIIKHAAFPFPSDEATVLHGDPSAIPCLKIIGAHHGRARSWRPRSIINVSAMSYGSLGERAISALNKGAAAAGCYHNTGEGGVSRFHCFGADVIWQLGTGYYGARGPDGRFSLDVLAGVVERTPSIRAIEIKLSQGAKPGKGGILPAAKVTPAIAEARGIPVGETCYSPNHHDEFGDVDAMIDFIEAIAARTGLPVGIKSAVGEIDFWRTLGERMRERDEGPDFLCLDGAEGGTGAAPLAFSDHVALPFKVGFGRVYATLQAAGVSERLVWIGSGRLGFPDRAVIGLAMGCDMIAIAREAMMAIGCIQAQRCHTDECPAGIATHSPWLQGGVNVEDKAERFARFVEGFRKELLTLAHAAGYQHPGQFTGRDVEVSCGVNEFRTLAEVMGYCRDEVPFTKMEDYG